MRYELLYQLDNSSDIYKKYSPLWSELYSQIHYTKDIHLRSHPPIPIPIQITYKT